VKPLIAPPPVLLVALLSLAPQHGGPLAFAPRAGSSVVKQLEFELTMSEPAFAWDAGELWNLGGPPLRLSTSLTLTDSYASVSAGRPLDWMRRVDATSGKFEHGGRRRDVVGFFSLLGCAVQFERRKDEQQFARTLAEGSAEDLHIEDWVEDLDLRGFLPEGEVKPGEKWIAHGRPVMDALFGPSEMGFLGTPRDQRTETLVRDVLLSRFRELGDKGLEIECARSRSDEALEQPGTKIELLLEDKGVLDVTDTINEFLQRMDSNTFDAGPVSMEWKVDGSGSLMWDPTQGRFESLDFAADLQLEFTCSLSATPGGLRPGSLRLRSVGVGKWTYRAKSAE